MKENIGKTVKLKIASLKDDKYNPRKLKGKIIGINPRYPHGNPYIVEWSNGIRNSYELRHLQLL